MRTIVALAALLTAALLPTAAQAAYEHDEAAIVRVYCKQLVGASAGTAFKVSTTGYITAAHVVNTGFCSVGGMPISLTSYDAASDYATFLGPASPAILRASCEGYRPGQLYAARGYPGGGTYNIFTPWLALNMRQGLFDTFFASDAIPGMSGGPILDERGTVIGLTNMRFPPRSIPLSRTGYCKR